MPDYLMTVQDVAELAKLSADRVRELDSLFLPQRRPNGYRRYRPDLVEAGLAKRAAK